MAQALLFALYISVVNNHSVQLARMTGICTEYELVRGGVERMVTWSYSPCNDKSSCLCTVSSGAAVCKVLYALAGPMYCQLKSKLMML